MPIYLALALFIGSWAQQPGHDQKSDHGKDSKNPLALSKPVVDSKADSQPPAGTGSEKQEEPKPVEVIVTKAPNRDRFDWASLIINACLALIGFSGVVVAIVTLRKISRQTDATEAAAIAGRDAAEAALKQVRLQQATMRQWIELEKWVSIYSAPKGIVEVTFVVANRSDYVLFLEQGEFTFERPKKQTVLFAYRRTSIPPGHGHSFSMKIPISREQSPAFMFNKLIIPMKALITFRGALGEEIVQDFDGLLHCGATKTWFESHVVLREVAASENADG